mmetsp:Transcript_11192/g.31397  ORF Transcript_11192/g.31397 Transcript_11192/m.31397 type:complete len:203 (-) Transcript_11192:14-622(-)
MLPIKLSFSKLMTPSPTQSGFPLASFMNSRSLVWTAKNGMHGFPFSSASLSNSRYRRKLLEKDSSSSMWDNSFWYFSGNAFQVFFIRCTAEWFSPEMIAMDVKKLLFLNTDSNTFANRFRISTRCFKLALLTTSDATQRPSLFHRCVITPIPESSAGVHALPENSSTLTLVKSRLSSLVRSSEISSACRSRQVKWRGRLFDR